MREFTMLAAAALTACGAAPANNQVADVLTSPTSPHSPTAPRGGSAVPCVAPLPPAAEANCDFGPAERMQGIWINGFEQSAFIADATAAPRANYAAASPPWLTFAEGIGLDPKLRAQMEQARGTNAVAIEFVGRRSRERRSRVVIVDRLIATRFVGPLAR